MQKQVSYVAIINAQEAKIFEKVGKKLFELNLVEELSAELDTFHEKPQSSMNSATGLRHGVEPHTDRRNVEKQKFARLVAETLERAANDNRFEDLILISSHKMLGMVEESLSSATAKKISHKLAKDLVEFKDHEVKEYLAKNVWL